MLQSNFLKKSVFAVLFIILVFLIVFFCASIFFNTSNEIIGSIVHFTSNEQDFWGIKQDFWSSPFNQKTMRVSNLSKEFQVSGLKVKCKYEVLDVIGTTEFSTIAEIISIQKIN